MFVETRGSGPDVVLVHGWAMHSGIFAPLVKLLEARCTLHLVDLPGHGRSAEREGPLELGGTAQRLLSVLPRATWIGWSLGGLVCLEAARRAPEQFDALALIATSPCFVRHDEWPHGVEHAV
ncbi:MAG TPA: alpha/beta fold hydrolase, partial [Xanthomonadales bacterium]|nr:alpha/beta fold hydrolase [Xanthomonadales bacterium]